MALSAGRIEAGLDCADALEPKTPLKQKFQHLAGSKPQSYRDCVVKIQNANLAGMEKIGDAADNLLEQAKDSKRYGKHKEDPLGADELAAIFHYTDEDCTTPALYKAMNAACYMKDRRFVEPFVDIIWLLLHSLMCLVPFMGTVYRGVKANLAMEYTTGRRVTWHGFASCTTTIETLKQEMFFGTSGVRTFFIINLTQKQARDISRQSLISEEAEVLLPPGSRFEVTGCLPSGEVTIVTLQEIESQELILDLRPKLEEPQQGALFEAVAQLRGEQKILQEAMATQEAMLKELVQAIRSQEGTQRAVAMQEATLKELVQAVAGQEAARKTMHEALEGQRQAAAKQEATLQELGQALGQQGGTPAGPQAGQDAKQKVLQVCIALAAENVLATARSFARAMALGLSDVKELEDAKRFLLVAQGRLIREGDAGSYPIFEAAATSDIDALRGLLQAGCNKDVKDSRGQTALHLAAQKGHVEIVRCLMEAGDQKDAQDSDRQTALHLAAQKGHVEIARCLLEAGAEKDARDSDSDTPLHVAAANDRVEIIKLLLDAKADKDARHKFGRTPLRVALRDNNSAAAAALRAAGARE